MTVGENVKRIRKEKGLTQKQLGDLCGINEANIRKYESGKQNAKIKTLDKIATALGVNVVDLMGLEYFDSITNLDALRKDIAKADQFEKLFLSKYGEKEYDSFRQYSVLTEEGARKVRAYINDLFNNPTYRADSQKE